MPGRADRAAGVVDLRVGAPERDDLLVASRAELAARAPDDRLVVVVATGELTTLHTWFVRAAVAVRSGLCIAVGEIERPGGGFELRQSAAVAPPWGTLWVGGDRCARWTAGSDTGSDLPAGADGLDQLLTVLTAPAVFDEVLLRLADVRHRMASPAVELVRSAGGTAERRTAQVAALRSLAGTPVTGAVAALVLPESVLAPAAAPQAVPALQPVRDRSRWALDRATRTVARLRGPAGPLTAPSPAAVADALATVDHALAEHRKQAVDFLGTLATPTGRPPGADGSGPPGLPAPAPVGHEAVAAGLRSAITAALTGGASLPEAAAALRATSRRHGGSTVGQVRQDLAALPRIGVGDPPGARLSGAACAALAAVALGSTAVAAALPTLALWGGAGLAVVWALLVGVVVARLPRPGPGGSPHLLPLVAVAAAVAGTGVGATVLSAPFTGVPFAVEAAVDGTLLLVAAGAVRAAWDAALARWTSDVPLASAARDDELVAGHVDAAVAGPHHQSLGRARISDAAALLAVGVTDTAEACRTWADRLEGDLDPLAGRPAFRASEVMRADLAALAVTGLDPYLADVAAGAPLAVSTTAAPTDLLADLDVAYDAYVARGSLEVPPPVGADPAVRARLTAATWQQTAGVRRLLTGDDRVPMTQLCSRHEFRALDPDWRTIRVLRFAPAAARAALGDLGDEVVPCTADAAGLLRLVPLRRGTVRYVQPQATGFAGEPS